MEYLITFLEGVISFISPCILPMIPIYLLYFMGDGSEEKSPVKNGLGFILGFTLVFVALGALSGMIGGFFQSHRSTVNLVCGILIILLGLVFMRVIKIPGLTGTYRVNSAMKPRGFFTTVLFGMIFAFGWSPCVGPFLGSALLLGSQQGSVISGILLLLAYSLGLGIPFFLSAILVDQLKGAFTWMKKHNRLIHSISGGLLILLGLLMVTGLLNSMI